MKSAGILTFHFPDNCGAVLQCLALQTKLEQMGFQVSVIDYRPWYHVSRYTLKVPPAALFRDKFRKKKRNETYLYRFKRSVYWTGKCLAAQFTEKETQQQKAFRQFRDTFLKAGRRFTSLEELRSDPPVFDLYISGSDQVWNAALTENRLDPAYLLDFGPDQTLRCTYAVGFDFRTLKDGIPPYPVTKIARDSEEELLPYQKALARLQTISLRERNHEGALRKVYAGPLREDLDPTLLLSAEDYEAFTPREPLSGSPFLFAYVVKNGREEETLKAAKLLAEKRKLPLFVAGDRLPALKGISGAVCPVCGPGEFLWYMRHADGIITDSFHGTVFSVLFGRPFAVLPSEKTGYRIGELLEKLGLSGCICHDAEEAAKKALSLPDFSQAEMTLAALRKDSESYIRSWQET